MKTDRTFLIIMQSLFCIACGVKGRPLPPDNPYFVDKTQFKAKDQTTNTVEEQKDSINSEDKKKTQTK